MVNVYDVIVIGGGHNGLTGYADFRAPIGGLYRAISACHAGGGVCGVPAYLAVKEILSDRRLKRSGARAAGS